MDARDPRRLFPLVGVLAAVYAAMVLLSAMDFSSRTGRWHLRAPVFLVQTAPDGDWSLNVFNQRKILEQAGINLILGVGMTFVILTAGIDLSVGSTLGVCNVLFVVIALRFGGEDPGIAVPSTAYALGAMGCLLAGPFIGALNGVLTVYGGVPSFITTLGMFLIGQGAAYLLADGRTHFLPCPQPLNIVIPLAFCAAAVGMAHVVLSRTVLGRQVYAVGSNPQAARLCGVPVDRVRVATFVISGFCASLGGLIYWARLSTGSHQAAYNGYELYAIATVVIGGTSLMGGQGSVLGTLIGALIMAVLYNGLNTVGIEETTQKIIIGAVIVCAAMYDHRRHRTAQ